MYLLKSSLNLFTNKGTSLWDPVSAAGLGSDGPQELKPAGSLQRCLQDKEPFGFGLCLFCLVLEGFFCLGFVVFFHS